MIFGRKMKAETEAERRIRRAKEDAEYEDRVHRQYMREREEFIARVSNGTPTEAGDVQ